MVLWVEGRGTRARARAAGAAAALHASTLSLPGHPPGRAVAAGAGPLPCLPPGAFRAVRAESVHRRGPVNRALRTLLENHRPAAAPLATTLDLYRELQAATPDSLRYLLRDLFETNTYWELGTKQATAKQLQPGTWQVTLAVRARKAVVDSAGGEREVPMHDWVEVGVFAPAEKGEPSGQPLYLRKHRLRSGQQTITVPVKRQPTRAGLDPYHLLIDLQREDNLKDIGS
ncbi:hypothetical protein H9L05_21255 (plasmid) [Hymenobacter qilianensis]|uniref:Uncharacterized protein n=1 Tax=Hymenobacter qilianensis TaxID=1385715 RepID=A0A7H0H0Z8_9BACT|nr:hypothetical protein [Hymenobacter qilianensis]QNP54214.1 hypothetical protein H9L05_21255 [Hymenobacter qilianensis]